MNRPGRKRHEAFIAGVDESSGGYHVILAWTLLSCMGKKEKVGEEG